MAEMSVPAWPIPIQNTKVVMYIAHICGTRLPAMPMPHQTWPAHAKKKPASSRATTHIQAKYRLPGGSSVRRTSRLTSAKVGGVLWPSLIGSRVLADDLPEIRDGGPRSDLFEDVVGPRRMGEIGGVAPLVLQVAERDGLGRARLLARGDDVAVAHAALLVARPVLAGDDALDAHRALLHHAELADRHVGVQLYLEGRRELVLEPVEPPHVIRAVVAAVARADASVVDLSVQPLVRAVGREDGADRLARRDLAVLAEHRQEEIRRMLRLAFRPALEAEPVQLAPVRGRGLPHHRDVVLRLARDHARDRKSTRLNSSHTVNSYAVFCLKQKKKHHSRSPLSARTKRAMNGSVRNCGR